MSVLLLSAFGGRPRAGIGNPSGKERLRHFGYLAAISAPRLALLAFLAYGSRRFLLDGAFISFRYARNLLEGNGLVWNPESAWMAPIPVEGTAKAIRARRPARRTSLSIPGRAP